MVAPPGPDGTVTIGVDMGGSKCLSVVVDASHRILGRHVRPTPGTGAADVLDALAEAVEQCRRDRPDAVAVGVGMPGLVTAAGVLRFAPHLPGVVDLDVAGELESRIGLPVHVGNDNTAAAIAEHRAGAGYGAPDLLFVGFGTGIGGAFLSAGRPVRGAHGFAGELGHVVVDPSGLPCICGRVGCWETVASGTALARAAAAAGLGSAEEAVAAARNGDPAARGVVLNWSDVIARGLADLVMILDPDRIVIGGGPALAAAPVMLEGLGARIAGHLGRAGAHRQIPAVATATLGVPAAAIGAAIAARDAQTTSA